MCRNRKAFISYYLVMFFYSISISSSPASTTEDSNSDPNELYNMVVEGILENCKKFECGVLRWEKVHKQRDIGNENGLEEETQGVFQMWYDREKMATKATTWKISRQGQTEKRGEEVSVIRVYDGNECRGMTVGNDSIFLDNKPRFNAETNLFESYLWPDSGSSIIDRLAKDMNNKQVNMEWSIIDSNGTQYIRLKNHNKNYGSFYTIDYFDPKKGCMLVRHESFRENKLSGWRTWTMEEVSQGMWFPVEFNQHATMNMPEIGTFNTSTRKVVDLNKSSFNDRSVIPKDVFKLEITPDINVIIDYRNREKAVLYSGDGVAKFLEQGRQRWSLLVNVGAALPEFDGIKIDLDKEKIRDKKILVCFFDMEQRPSRNCILQISKRAQELKAKDIMIVIIQAASVEKAKLDKWIKENNISFPVGTIEGDSEKTRFAWGVKSLPWLILTDKKHTVVAEGFGIDELEEKI